MRNNKIIKYTIIALFIIFSICIVSYLAHDIKANSKSIVKINELLQSNEYKKPAKYDSASIINLPLKIYGLVGQELNIYFDNIINGKDTDYDFVVTCDNGNQYENFWRYVPSKSGTFKITIEAQQNGKVIDTKTADVIISDAGIGKGVNKKVLLLGDSTTANGIISTKLNEDFSNDVMDITLLGTRGASPNLHEGRSGWTTELYNTVESDVNGAGVKIMNPFYNSKISKFDFQNYLSVNNIERPDVVIINLGINDMFYCKSDQDSIVKAESVIAYYNSMIESIQDVDPNIKVGVALTIPPNYSQDAFGKAYGCRQNRMRYKRNNEILVNMLIEQYKEAESNNIYMVPININLDTRYNMGLEDMQVNAKNDKTYLSPILNGCVHPVESGYSQIADIYWYWLKSLEL